uniref:Alcohol dehydrogenase n=1 Tax=Globodera rostochiensis TaxID=31243 RepID=A0A914I2N7_GLORO
METEGKVINCRAAVSWEPNKPLIVEQIEVSPPKAGEVRVKILFTGICHTDIFVCSGKDSNVKYPMIAGHEATGIVESVGFGVHGILPGDHVIPAPIPQCRNCEYCYAPETNLCEFFQFGPSCKVPLQTMLDGTSRFKCRGQDVFHFIGTSTFSEYTVVLESCICKINPKAPMDIVVALGCGFTTGYGNPYNVSPVVPGSAVGIWGLGAIGLGVMVACKERGAKHIVAVDPQPNKLQLATKFGATEMFSPNDRPDGKSLPEYLREKYDGGLLVAFEAAGSHLAARQAFESTKKGFGQTVVLGVIDQELQIPPDMLLMGRTIKGAIYGGWKSRDALPMLVEKYMKGQLPLEEFISCRMQNLDQINEGIQRMEKCEGIRTVIPMATMTSTPAISTDGTNATNNQHSVDSMRTVIPTMASTPAVSTDGTNNQHSVEIIRTVIPMATMTSTPAISTDGTNATNNQHSVDSMRTVIPTMTSTPAISTDGTNAANNHTVVTVQQSQNPPTNNSGEGQQQQIVREIKIQLV